MPIENSSADPNSDIAAVPLTDETLVLAVGELAARDHDLARICKKFGPPPMWDRQTGFPTLLHIILEQQVSLASACAAYERLLAAATPLTPQRFLDFTDADLKTIGFSRQKTHYGRHLAAVLVNGELDLEALATMPDDEVRQELMKVKGIGRWTADIYLLMVLRRPDIWPRGDLALATAMQEVKRLAAIPSNAEMTTISNDWRPWRAVAARLLWHHYLSQRARKTANAGTRGRNPKSDLGRN